jgi:hypothetical protein
MPRPPAAVFVTVTAEVAAPVRAADTVRPGPSAEFVNAAVAFAALLFVPTNEEPVVAAPETAVPLVLDAATAVPVRDVAATALPVDVFDALTAGAAAVLVKVPAVPAFDESRFDL